MAKKSFTPTEEGSSVPEAFAEAPPVAPASEAAAAPDSAPASSIKPLKPGVRKMTLAQARAHHAEKHLGQI